MQTMRTFNNLRESEHYGFLSFWFRLSTVKSVAKALHKIITGVSRYRHGYMGLYSIGYIVDFKGKILDEKRFLVVSPRKLFNPFKPSGRYNCQLCLLFLLSNDKKIICPGKKI